MVLKGFLIIHFFLKFTLSVFWSIVPVHFIRADSNNFFPFCRGTTIGLIRQFGTLSNFLMSLLT